ncbi:MAG: family 78 glycoside hydrolase catalytic domain, partial [Mycetocola sp.]
GWGDCISPVEPVEIGVYRPGYLLERTFTLVADARRGRLYATALGIYEAFVNGVRVGDHELAPGATNYDSTVYAQAFDIMPLLQRGQNQIQIVLSDGWFRGRNGSEQTQNCWGETTGVRVQLEIAGADGRNLIVASDGAWTSRESEIVRADLMRGQTTDFTRVEVDPVPVRVGVVNGPEPAASPAPPVRRIEELPVVKSFVKSEDVTIFDFGQNITGWVRLTDLGDTGAETVLEFAQHLDPGETLTTAHLDTLTPRGLHIQYAQIDRVIAGPGSSVFEPRHTVHGFRYVRVTHPGRTLSPESVTAIVVHSDLTRTGWFECSDDRINRLHEAGRWTFRDNAVDVPTDCPTRERSGWTGDFQIFAPTAAMLFDIEGFSRKWLQAVRDDQYDDGCLAMFSPDQLRMRRTDNPDRIGGGSAGWGDAAVSVPWTLYRHYGDVRVLEESWESAIAWIEYALGCARRFRHPSRVARAAEPAAHEEYIWDGPFHFGEWLEPRDPKAPQREPAEALRALFAADQGEVGTAYLHRSLSQLVQMAQVLDRPEDEARLAALADLTLAAWRTEFLRPDGRTVADTQAAYVRAIAFGLVPEGHIAAASARLVELISERDDHLGTGFLTTGMLLPVLAGTGHTEAAYRLLTQTGVPSWLEMLDRGGTTFWENWENVEEDGTVRSGSLNHYSKGAVVGFFYSHIVGLRQDDESAGWQRFTVAPVFGGGLTHASATLHTPVGDVSVSWRRDGAAVEMTVTVPDGAEARGVLPGLRETFLPAGTTTTLRSTFND